MVHVPADLGSLPASDIRALLADRAGTLWIGTASALARLRPQGESAVDSYDPHTEAIYPEIGAEGQQHQAAVALGKLRKRNHSSSLQRMMR